jgi:Fe2+ or Zn2+ uptake regulation protein
MHLTNHAKSLLEEALNRKGLRATRQREHIFAVLLDKRDHPSADEIYARAKESMPSISLATVYNCLETLVDCGLVRQVNIEREPSRFCPNLAEHAHFHCKKTGRVYDITLPDDFMNDLKTILPQGYTVEDIELSYHGESPESTTVTKR